MQNSAFHSESDGPLECAKLPDRFIKHDTCCGRKIQASGLLPHGNCQAMLRIRGEETLWQALGFASKNEMITMLELLPSNRAALLSSSKTGIEHRPIAGARLQTTAICARHILSQ